MYENKFGLENGEIDLAPSEEQTNYDYIIVKHYSKKLKELSSNTSMNEIFLTYQKTIFQPFPCEQNDYIYTPIMLIKHFIKISILENININISLYKVLIYDYFNNIINSHNINKTDKEIILGFATDSTNWKDIITNEPNQLVNNIKNNEKELKILKQETEEKNKNIENLKEEIKLMNENRKK